MIYRTEHPKPQFERENWQNLNGEWEFEMDFSVSGAERKMQENDYPFSKTINVPFCVESELSGIGYKDFINSVWYRRKICISDEQLKNKILLHFGAVDYKTVVYINGKKCGEHKGGYSSFSFDITNFLNVGANIITVNALDDTRNRLIPSGKQSQDFASNLCVYTRTTGIWQTVWLEFVPKNHIISAKYITNIDTPSVTINADLHGKGEFIAEAFYKGKSVGKVACFSFGGNTTLTLNLSEKHLWEVGNGRLYDLKLTFCEDNVKSYFGLRSLTLDGHKFLINGKSVFQRLVLDQGFYPQGVCSAPSDKELINDIKLSLAMGFNGARLHQKVFEERFLYHCDCLGYIVWGEYPCWGLDHTYADSIYGILPEWLEIVKRDFNHPAIVAWCPFNETWEVNGRKQYDDVIRLVYLATKAADETRPCIDTSGNYHVLTDIYDLHDYEANPKEFKAHYDCLKETGDCAEFERAYKNRQQYDGKMPFCVSEYGGIGLNQDEGAWGYGDLPKTEEEFYERLKGLTDVLLDNDRIFSFCYTQLTDIEQEQNGLYTFDRKPKLSAERIKTILSRKAAIED